MDNKGRTGMNAQGGRHSGGGKSSKSRIVVVIVVIAVVAAVVALVVLQPWTGGSTGQAPTPPPNLTIEDAAPDGVVAGQDGQAENMTDTADFFSNTGAYLGQSVIVTGTVVGEPLNNQGILAFTIKTDGGDYAAVNMFDESGAQQVASGDKLTVTGTATANGSGTTETGETQAMPMINATQISPAG